MARPADDAMDLPTPALAASPTNATKPAPGTTVPVTLDTTFVADEVVLRIDGAVRRGQPTTVSAVPANADPGTWTVDVDCTTVSGIRAFARGVLRVE